MQPPLTIEAQLEVSWQNLTRCRSAVANSDIDALLRKRVAARFDNELTRLEAGLTAVREKIQTGQALEACWRDLGKLQHDASRVFDECLAFVQGALARKAGLDGQICSLTDNLLDDLATASDIPWGRFTLLASSEFYRDIAEIIRVRYPDVSVWAMPLATHEFGHYIGPQLRQRRDGEFSYPFQTLLKTADEDRTDDHTRDWYHLQEQFADVFATYTMGPAFAAAFIGLRMNPEQAQKTARTHPSGAWRVHGILWLLDKMDELPASPLQRPFRDVTALLRDNWAESLRRAGNTDKLPDQDASLVNQRMDKLFKLLTDTTPQQLVFGRTNWQRAMDVADCVLVDRPIANSTQVTRRDVVNGAWLARLYAPDQSVYGLNRIAERALNEYRRLPQTAN